MKPRVTMKPRVITVYNSGKVSSKLVKISRKAQGTVVWKGRKKNWRVVFSGACPFTAQSFRVPARRKSVLAQQKDGVKLGRYHYDVSGKDPDIEIIP